MRIFELFGEVLIHDTAATNSINNIDKKASGLGKVLDGLGKIALVAGAAIITGFGAALVSGMKGVSEGEDAIAQLDAVLKSTGGSAGVLRKDLIDMADQFQKTTKFTQEEVLAAESLLLTFTNIGEKTFPRATQAAADMATALGTDMAGQSIALGKALNDPTKGITALTRVGVSFTEEQKKSIKAMQEHGDMAGAQTIILKELEKEFGGSALAAGQTFSGQLEILKNAFGEVTEELAIKFMPYLQKFMDFVVAHMPQIQATFETVFKVIGDVIKVVADVFKDYLIPAFQALWNWIEPNIPAIKEIISSSMTSVKELIDSVMAIIKVIWEKYGEDIKKYTAVVFDAIKIVVKTAMDFVKDIIDIATALISGDWKGAWDGIKKGFSDVWDGMFELVGKLLEMIKIAINTQLKIIGDIFGDIWKGICDSVIGMWNGLKTKATEIFLAIWNTIKSAFDATISWFKNIFTGAWEGIKSVFSGVGAFFGGIWDIIKEKFTTIGSSIGNAMGDAFKFVVNSIIGFAENTINGFINAINGAIGMINKIPGVEIGMIGTVNIPKLEKGTDYWEGGIANIHEIGGEIIDLPRGSRVIPHDVSMEMAKNSGGKVGSKGDVYIENVTIDARNIKDFNNVIEIFQNLNQTNRGGVNFA